MIAGHGMVLSVSTDTISNFREVATPARSLWSPTTICTLSNFHRMVLQLVQMSILWGPCWTPDSSPRVHLTVRMCLIIGLLQMPFFFTCTSPHAHTVLHFSHLQVLTRDMNPCSYQYGPVINVHDVFYNKGVVSTMATLENDRLHVFGHTLCNLLAVFHRFPWL